MAVVGDAYIVVRALTNRVRPEIQRAFSGLDDIGRKAGDDISNAMNDSFDKGGGGGGRSAVGRVLGGTFERDAEAARIKLRGLTQAGFFLGPALTGVLGGIGALGTGLVTLGAAAGAAAQSGFLVLGGAFTALIQSAITLKLAFSGVAAALQAGNKASSGGAAQAKALEAAQNRLKKAQLALFRVEQDRIDQIKDIQRANSDAQRSAIDAIISARRSERSYEAAQRNTKKVIEEVTQAREDAIETLQQLRFEVEGGAISEKKARIEFEKARDSLQRVQDLPPNSRARQEAELAFSEADLNLRKAIDRNQDLKDSEKKKTVEVAKLRATEIMKTQEVKDAVQAEADARIDAARASVDAKNAEKAAIESAADIDSGKAFRDINRSLADANEAVKEARKDLADAKGGGGAADAFAEAMAKLSPEAQKFVRFLQSIQGEFKKLKAAAGRELFPRLETAIQNLVDNLFPRLEPLLEGTGKALGDVAIELSNVITDADNLKSLESVWKNNDKFIGNLGTTVGNLYTGFLNILEAAGPLITRFGEWLVVVSGTWAETRKLQNQSGELTKKFDRLGDITADIGGYLKTFWSGLKDIFAVATQEGGAIDDLSEYFQKAADKFKAFTSAGREDGSLNTFLKDATENATKVLSFLSEIVKQLLRVGETEGVGKFVDSLTRATETFGDIGVKLSGPDGATAGLGTFIEKFADMSELLTDSGTIEMFFNILNGALGIVNKILGNEVVQNVLKVVGVVVGLSKGFGVVLRVLKFVGLAFAGTFIKIFKFAKDPFAALRKGSGLTRTELKKQMVVDAQKKSAMNGLFLSGKQAARGINLIPAASTNARIAMLKSSIETKKATIALKLHAVQAKITAAASRVGAAASRGFGSAMALIGGPIGLIILLLPFIIGLIKKLWEENETFRNVVKSVMDFVLGLWNSFVDTIKAVWEFVRPIFTIIGNAVKTYITLYVEGLIAIWNGVVAVVRAVWGFLEPIFRFIGNAVKNYITFYVNALKLAWEVIVKVVQTVWNFLKPIFETIGNFIRDRITNAVNNLKAAWEAIKGAVKAVGDFLSPIFKTIGDFIRTRITDVVNNLKAAWDGIKTAVNAVWTFVQPILSRIGNFIRSTIGAAISAVTGAFNGIVNVAKGVFNNLARAWNNTLGSFRINIPKIGPFGGGSIGFPKLPLLADGGVIPPTVGGTAAIIGEAGQAERVEPLDANGMSKRDKFMMDMIKKTSAGTTINVYPSAGMDERELADLVSRKLAQTMRRGAA
jgi:phage-related protein